MAVCWVILRGQQMYTVIKAVHSLLYIVTKCHFFSVVTWRDILKYLQKCEGCTHFCEILYDWLLFNWTVTFCIGLYYKTVLHCWYHFAYQFWHIINGVFFLQWLAGHIITPVGGEEGLPIWVSHWIIHTNDSSKTQFTRECNMRRAFFVSRWIVHWIDLFKSKTNHQ